MRLPKWLPGGLPLALAMVSGFPAHAEMVLSQVIVDLLPDKPSAADVEVFNDGPQRMYVSAEPFEILRPGTATEARVLAGDPETSGILVSPRKLVLAPGERRIIRVAAVGSRPEQDRVYRVAIKPVAGPISANESALKVFVGYDALVIVRPAQLSAKVAGQRDGRMLALTNSGNTSEELFDGRQCDPSGKDCRTIEAKRLYAGQTWRVALPFDTPVSYKAAAGDAARDLRF